MKEVLTRANYIFRVLTKRKGFCSLFVSLHANKNYGIAFLSRYTELAKTHLQEIATATAINVLPTINIFTAFNFS
jgi:hypothetical protein